MAGTAWFLPRSLRREIAKVPKDARQSLTLAQEFHQKDWESIKAAYKTGPFTASPVTHVEANGSGPKPKREQR